MSLAEQTILLHMGETRALSEELLNVTLQFVERVATQAEDGGPMLRRSIRSEAGMDVDGLARRAAALLETSTQPADTQSQLFEGG